VKREGISNCIVGLIGNPNSGKTTLFNQLTGASQEVGNWPGVTVERKTGSFVFKGKTVQVVDLPGVYSLSHFSESSLDEDIARNFILSNEADVLVNVLDGSNLERHLYLTAQLIEMQVPVVLAVNMMDVLEKKGVLLDVERLAKRLGCPVVPLVSHKGNGVEMLKAALVCSVKCPATPKDHPVYSVEIEAVLGNSNCTRTPHPPCRAPSPARGEGTPHGDLCVGERPYGDLDTGEEFPYEDFQNEESQSENLIRKPSETEDLQKKKTTPDNLQKSDEIKDTTDQGGGSPPLPKGAAGRKASGGFIEPKISRYSILRQLETQARQDHWQEDPDIMIASARYTWAHEVAKDVLNHEHHAPQRTLTSVLDKWVLNRFLGIPIFLMVIYFMFLFAIHIGGIFQDFFDLSSDVIFVQGVAHGLHALSAPDWLIAILATGVGKGLNTTLSFIPVLAAMFFCLSFLEASGYMARAAFVMDKVMQALGLPGKALVPMIVGFGCNVPAIMGARTLSDPRDRVLTVMMSPFMSCSARLAVYSVFVAAFFPTGGQNVVFMLYVFGMIMAVLTGYVLRKTLVHGKPSPWIMELPEYHIPSWKALFFPTVLRTKNFLFRAGKVIVPVCMILGMLNALTIDGHVSLGDADSDSLLSVVGRFMTPIFTPMGLTTDNWPATVGLLMGGLAKEVVVATLNTLYVQAGHLSEVAAQASSSFDWWGGLKAAVMSIPEHIQALPDAIRHPLLASVPNSDVSSGVYGEMVTRFASTQAALAYLLFVLLYVPCASTMAAIRKELNTGWMLFSIAWSTILAYVVAVLYYQSVTLMQHPVSSSLWLLGILLFCTLAVYQMKKVGAERHAARH
jgi:ferrous iron transporter FeoB